MFAWRTLGWPKKTWPRCGAQFPVQTDSATKFVCAHHARTSLCARMWRQRLSVAPLSTWVRACPSLSVWCHPRIWHCCVCDSPRDCGRRGPCESSGLVEPRHFAFWDACRMRKCFMCAQRLSIRAYVPALIARSLRFFTRTSKSCTPRSVPTRSPCRACTCPVLRELSSRRSVCTVHWRDAHYFLSLLPSIAAKSQPENASRRRAKGPRRHPAPRILQADRLVMPDRSRKYELIPDVCVPGSNFSRRNLHRHSCLTWRFGSGLGIVLSVLVCDEKLSS